MADNKDAKSLEAASNGSHNINDIRTGFIQYVDQGSDHAAASALKRKLDLHLMTLLCITYALQSIDKTTIGYAAVFGLKTDLNLKDTEYSWLGALFYLGYLAWEFPTNIMLQRLPINLFMALTVSRPRADSINMVIALGTELFWIRLLFGGSCCCAMPVSKTFQRLPPREPFWGSLRRPSIQGLCCCLLCKNNFISFISIPSHILQ